MSSIMYQIYLGNSRNLKIHFGRFPVSSNSYLYCCQSLFVLNGMRIMRIMRAFPRLSLSFIQFLPHTSEPVKGPSFGLGNRTARDTTISIKYKRKKKRSRTSAHAFHSPITKPFCRSLCDFCSSLVSILWILLLISPTCCSNAMIGAFVVESKIPEVLGRLPVPLPVPMMTSLLTSLDVVRERGASIWTSSVVSKDL